MAVAAGEAGACAVAAAGTYGKRIYKKNLKKDDSDESSDDECYTPKKKPSCGCKVKVRPPAPEPIEDDNQGGCGCKVKVRPPVPEPIDDDDHEGCVVPISPGEPPIEGPTRNSDGTVSVSIGSAENYNRYENTQTNFNFPTL